LELIPSQALMACSELLHLDLSNNELDALPPQLRRKHAYPSSVIAVLLIRILIGIRTMPIHNTD
jgi:hypothetical protein